jgi:hypothetical protein
MMMNPTQPCIGKMVLGVTKNLLKTKKRDLDSWKRKRRREAPMFWRL